VAHSWLSAVVDDRVERWESTPIDIRDYEPFWATYLRAVGFTYAGLLAASWLGLAACGLLVSWTILVPVVALAAVTMAAMFMMMF
jgi:hypothetical protein